MLKKLIEISIKLTSEKNLDKLLELIINSAIDFLQAERATVFLLDEKTNELYSRVGTGLNFCEIKFPIDKGIAGYVAKTGESLIIENPQDHPLFNKEIDSKTGFVTRDILTAPMKNIEGKVIGVFQVLNKLNGKFTEEDNEYALAFASISAIAIENAKLIEEQKRQYELLQKAYKELQAAQETIIKQEKFATIGQLASGINHEIKNQLGVVMAVEAIRKMYPDNHKVQMYTELILEARNRIVSLLDEIRDFSKKKDYEKTEINLIDLINHTLNICRFDKDLDTMKLIFQPAENIKPMVMVNADKIQQVLINLIRNAGHASEPRSKIEIEIENQENFWLIKIRDYGKGIPDDIKEKVWEPFFTTKSSGTGLGLDICKKIIENHNGEIWFESELGKGTTFFIKLPAIN
ncbi:MAG: GAF domain-containing sensor histidine kinase [Ignavibacteria bacterium]|jgi:signal transduction histidine kinase|nr:GAF domain-containing sensor histidine kinase [Ignavibacteria bacterium]MDH7527716.1 GAF domain-containing sensor histidine kinase [Ignavibacteria bacterium]